jgi:Trehalose utilisation
MAYRTVSIFVMLLATLATGMAQDSQDKLKGSTARPRKIAFVAGGASHGYGEHEHYAGCALLARELTSVLPGFRADIHRNGWPSDPSFFDGADCIVIFSDGGGGHPALKSLEFLRASMNRGVGLVCLHYAVEVPKGEPGNAFLGLLGGYFETDWSVNPHWTLESGPLPTHPITRGVHPLKVQDEWYFHMRFPPEMRGVTPILSAVPPPSTMERPDGPHSGNPAVRKEVAEGKPQHVAWAFERPEGGRAFGFTGAHFHWNWEDEAFRRIVLNAIVWASGGEVPTNGVPVRIVNRQMLEDNQDEPKP